MSYFCTEREGKRMKTIEMVVRVEVEAPEGVEVSNDMVRGWAANCVAAEERHAAVGGREGRLAGRWARISASVQAFGAVEESM